MLNQSSHSFQIILNGLLSFLFFQCTTIGFHRESVRNTYDFGEEKTFQVCTMAEIGVTEEEVNELFQHWNEELKLYSLKANLVHLRTMERPGFYGSDIIDYLYRLPMTKDCDRILYLKGRTNWDLAFEALTLGVFAGIGIKLERQGAVESFTQTRGYIKAKYISTLQLLFTSPKSTLVHEGYHLLGCGHQFFMDDCYAAIKRTKDLQKETNREMDFFGVVTTGGDKILFREQVR